MFSFIKPKNVKRSWSPNKYGENWQQNYTKIHPQWFMMLHCSP